MLQNDLYPTKRRYRLKKSSVDFFCPLCRTPRQLGLSSRLNKLSKIQILLFSAVLMLLFYPLMQERSVVLVFFVWILVEGIQKMLFRKDLPCPHCGFDATWYRKDVRVAKRLVKDFWQKNQRDPAVAKEEEKEAEVEKEKKPLTMDQNS